VTICRNSRRAGGQHLRSTLRLMNNLRMSFVESIAIVATNVAKEPSGFNKRPLQVIECKDAQIRGSTVPKTVCD
jgi:hypothetical protein